MKASLAIGILLLGIFACTPAFASPFDGWTLEQIRSHPGYEPITEVTCHWKLGYTTIAETDFPEPDAARDTWVGFIRIDPEHIVIFNRFGDGLTLIDNIGVSIEGPAQPIWLDKEAYWRSFYSFPEACYELFQFIDTCEENCG